MIALVRLLVEDHVKSIRVVAEFVLTAMFVIFMGYSRPFDVPTGFRLMAMYVIVLAPATTLLVGARAASRRSHCLVVHGGGRSRYLAAVVIAAFTIDAFSLLVGALCFVWSTGGDPHVATRVALLAALLAAIVALSAPFSQLFFGRWAILADYALVLYLAFGDPSAVPAPVSGVLRAAQPFLPRIGDLIREIAGRTFASTASTVAQVAGVTLVLAVCYFALFARRDLVFED